MFTLFKHLTRQRRFCGWLVATLIGVAAAGCGERVVPAPPAKMVFENGLFRILDVNVPPGTTLKHSYENAVTTIVMRDGARTRAYSVGGDWGEETTATLGAVRLGEAGEHGVQNAGEGDFQMFAVENLRGDGGGSTPPQPVNGMTPAAESPSFGAYEVRLADNNFQVSHVHTAPTVAVLVKGRILSQGAESKDPKIGEAPSGLKQLDQPGQWVFVPPGEAHYVVRLGGEPSHVVEVELR